MRKWMSVLAALLLTLTLSAPAGAIAIGGGSYGGEGESSGGTPAIGEGKAKEITGSEAEIGWDTDSTEETILPTDGYAETREPIRNGGESDPEEGVGDLDAPAENMAEEPMKEPEAAQKAQENLKDRLFIRSVETTQLWKLAVPALGAAAAIAALITQRRRVSSHQASKHSADEIPKTTFQSWDGK